MACLFVYIRRVHFFIPQEQFFAYFGVILLLRMHGLDGETKDKSDLYYNNTFCIIIVYLKIKHLY